MSEPLTPADDTDTLLGAAYDFPASPAPRLMYMVADSPACDGDLLCRHLWRTGVLGAPMCYFDPARALFMMSTRLQARSFRDLFGKLAAVRTSPGGVFGFRARRRDFRLLDIADFTAFARRFQVVFIDRRDDVAQAVAVTRAQGGPLAGGPYGFQPIADTLQALRDTRKAWHDNFRTIGARPIVVDHALLLADPGRVVVQVAGTFGVNLEPHSAIDIPLPPRPADPEAEAWVSRFRSEAVLHGVAISPTGQPPGARPAVAGGIQ